MTASGSPAGSTDPITAPTGLPADGGPAAKAAAAEQQKAGEAKPAGAK
jgi:hypothetical protein